MTATIYKIDKDNLTEMASEVLSFANVKSVFPQHIYDNSISEQISIPFTVDISSKYVPLIDEEEIMIVMREKVDSTSRGPYEAIINDAGEDIGQLDYKDKVPHKPWELPQGFVQIKGDNE